MKISFHGGARCVTGSKHLLSLNNGTNILLDCGMFQGMGAETDDLNASFGFEASGINYLIVSHAHIDHSGLIPKLVKEGFTGKIFCTPATAALCEVLLNDSAEIQTYELDYINRKRSDNGKQPIEPLYNADHVTQAMKLFSPCDFNEWISIDDSVEIMFTHTGHLIGSAAIHLRITEDGKETIITFSGDIGKYRSTLLMPPVEFPQADYIVLESTYGDKQHDMVFNTIDTVAKWINKICVEKQGKLIIPAFSVGRTQEVLYVLNQLSLENRLPAINYFVDSPMSIKATEIIKSYADEFNDRLQQVLKIDDDPFSFPGLKYVETVEDSRQLAKYNEPCVIISASGTADAGRVRHHIASCISNENNAVLLVGYCESNSLGGMLASGCKKIELFGNVLNVAAEIGQVKSMSGHGDYDDLLKFVSCEDPALVQKIFLVHGEYDVQQQLAARLERRGFTSVEMPGMHYEIDLNTEALPKEKRA